jgi:hypothetical protein
MVEIKGLLTIADTLGKCPINGFYAGVGKGCALCGDCALSQQEERHEAPQNR